jgi:hypothetical protein
MQGVAGADPVAGEWQPVKVTAMPMAKDAGSNERGFVFMFCFMEIGAD